MTINHQHYAGPTLEQEKNMEAIGLDMPNVKSKIGELPSLLVFIPPAPAPAPAPCSCCCCWWCWWWLWWVYSICILYLPWNSMATSGTSSRILWWVGRVMIRIFGHGLLNYHHLVGNLTVSSTYDMMSRSFEFRSGNHLHKNSLCQLFAAKSSRLPLPGTAAAYRQPDADDFDAGTARRSKEPERRNQEISQQRGGQTVKPKET